MADAHNASPTPLPPTRGADAIRANLVSGFLVFLIALPLCLAIANAYRFPPITGVWTAVLGGILTTFISNSQTTIKGPAAGLIVIVVGAVNGFETDIVKDRLGNPDAGGAEVKAYLDGLPSDQKSEVWAQAYHNALGVAVVAGVIQILFGLFRAGVLAEICPMTPVHALLASIGIVIMFKQAYLLFGLGAPGGEAIQSVIQLPSVLATNFQKEGVRDIMLKVGAVGLAGLAIMIGWGFITNRKVKAVPAQIVVLAICVPLSLALGLEKKFLVPMPDVMSNPQAAFAFPAFDRVLSGTGVMFIVLFALIGSLESLVSAKAVDLIDPWKRKTDLNRDMLAIGVANTAGAFIGAPPMISEIVRSKANIDNGARSKWADLFHGLFLLLAAVFLSQLLAFIPLAALAAMLVYTGFRLAHPREFVKTYKIGPEQLAVFLVTIVTILATDLLIGFLTGILLEFVIHAVNGLRPTAVVSSGVEVIELPGKKYQMTVTRAAVFSNWLGIKRKLDAVGRDAEVTLDLSNARLVDHTVMEKLHELEAEFRAAGGQLHLTGLDEHTGLSAHPLAARKKRSAPVGAPA